MSTTRNSKAATQHVLTPRIWKGFAFVVIIGGVSFLLSLQSDPVYSFLGTLLTGISIVSFISLCFLIWKGSWVAVSSFLGMLAFLSVAIMIWALLLLPLDDRQRHTISSSIGTGSGDLTINYPDRILANGAGSIITITLAASPPITSPLPLTLEVPNLLQFEGLRTSESVSTTLHLPHSAQIIFSANTSPQTATIRLADSLTEIGSFAPWIPQPQGSIQITSANAAVSSIDLQVEVESVARGTVRAFIQSELGERSPFLLLAATLVATVGWFFSQRDRQREEQKQDEQNARQNELIAQQKLAEEVATLRTLLRTGNLNEARQSLIQLNQHEQTRYLAEERAKIKLLLEVANEPDSYTKLDTLLDQWPAETAGVLIHIIGTLQKKDSIPADVRRMLRIVPLDRLEPAERIRFRDVRERCRIAISQPRIWPWPVNTASSPVTPPAPPPSPPSTIGELSIFPAAKAEDEPQLFSQSRTVFFLHPLYRQLKQTMTPTVVWGEPGVGKTAIARRLALFHDDADVLGCYQLGTPEPMTIWRSLAAQLINFVCLSPTWLGKLGEAERRLIASCSVALLSEEVVLSTLARGAAERQRTPLGGGEAPTDQVKIWAAEAEAQIAMFREDVLSARQSSPLQDSDWPYVICMAAQLLEFKQVRITLDVSGRTWRSWLLELIDSKLPQWYVAGITPVLFIPAQSPDILLQQTLFNCHELHWRPDKGGSLEEMARNRFGQMFGGYSSLDYYFESDRADKVSLSELVAAVEYNPQRLARLWITLQQQFPDKTRILRTMMQSAI